jgi:proteasome lid subunit RPN8/RPN11
MREHVISEHPLESCGLVGGQDGQAEVVIPVSNIAGSAVRFRMDPNEQIQAMMRIEESGWELLGIYHSHPQGPSGPSVTDFQEAAYPEAAYLIWFREGQTWSCRAFDLLENPGQEIPIVVEEG